MLIKVSLEDGTAEKVTLLADEVPIYEETKLLLKIDGEDVSVLNDSDEWEKVS